MSEAPASALLRRLTWEGEHFKALAAVLVMQLTEALVLRGHSTDSHQRTYDRGSHIWCSSSFADSCDTRAAMSTAEWQAQGSLVVPAE